MSTTATDKEISILQSWVARLGLRHQGVLLSCVRGCDGTSKEDLTKPFIREMRGLCLVPFDENEAKNPQNFMTVFPNQEATHEAFVALCKDLDPYPLHFLLHFIHATEVIGYCHPNGTVRATYEERYQTLVKRLHLNPEKPLEMHHRLNHKHSPREPREYHDY